MISPQNASSLSSQSLLTAYCAPALTLTRHPHSKLSPAYAHATWRYYKAIVRTQLSANGQDHIEGSCAAAVCCNAQRARSKSLTSARSLVFPCQASPRLASGHGSHTSATSCSEATVSKASETTLPEDRTLCRQLQAVEPGSY